MASSDLHKAVLKTLAYADVFHFPLSYKEVWFYLQSDYSYSLQAVHNTLGILVKKKIIYQNVGYYSLNPMLSGDQRVIKENIFKEKMNFLKKYIKIIDAIPTVLTILVSGSVAAHNAQEDDDIDLCIICEHNTVWLTRLLIYFVLTFHGVQRKRIEINTRNKICINLLFDKCALSFSKDNQNLYIAHEIAQAIPLIDHNVTYSKLWSENRWIQNYLINTTMHTISSSPRNLFWHSVAECMNVLVSWPQKWYMRLHTTTETITDTVLAFHPHNAMYTTLTEWQKRCEKLGIE